MKKLVALLLVAILVFGCVSAALADSASFNWSGTSTGWNIWTGDVKVSGSTWYVSWTETNLTEVTAKVKIWKADGNAASHTYYYSSESSASHSYLDGITTSNYVHIDGGRKTTGTTALSVSGTFYP